jgi:hypothetical protein
LGNIPDFSRLEVKEPKRFIIDDITYECSPVLPAGGTRTLAKLTRLQRLSAAEPADQDEYGLDIVEQLGEFMDTIMLPDSAKQFAERIRDPLHPIDDEQIGKIIVWLIGEYGGRPTNPPSPSSDGRNEIPVSTDGA